VPYGTLKGSRWPYSGVNGTLLGRIAWTPSLRKCASTTITSFFQSATRTKPGVQWTEDIGEEHRQHLAKDVHAHPHKWTDDQIARHFFQFTVVRDPLSRFLVGAYMLFLFHRLGWDQLTVNTKGVEYGARACLNQSWGESADKPLPVPCEGRPISTFVELLELVLDDIERVGYFDEHILPMS
jgi:hypothetical protein